MKYYLLVLLTFSICSAEINFDPVKAQYFSQNSTVNKEEYNRLYNNVIQMVRNIKTVNPNIDDVKVGLQIVIYLVRVNTPTAEQLICDLFDEKTPFEMDIKIQ